MEWPSCHISKEEDVNKSKLSNPGKELGPPGVESEMIKTRGDKGVKWLTNPCNDIIAEGRVPFDGKSCIIVPLFKGTVDSLECGSFGAIKLLEQPLKIVESARDENKIPSAGRWGCSLFYTMKTGNMMAIFIVRQKMRIHFVKKNIFYIAFVGIEKALIGV